MNRPELLIPAGNLEKLRTAVLYGADAVYAGVEGLSLRAKQSEFSIDDLQTGINEAHTKGVRVYAAINTFARNQDLSSARQALHRLKEIGVDGVILSDPGILRLVKEVAPKISIHLSTQANTTNSASVRFWQEQGVKRIVLARELNLKEIAEIAADVPDVEVELFIHGAMCMSYSGRCFLSYAENKRSANRGDCTHPCRWEYLLVESTRPNEPLILEDDPHYSYILSSKDLCMLEHIPEITNAGIASLKIEGRMKSAYYVAVVTRTYRWAIDAYLKDKEAYCINTNWLEELKKISYRGYTTGFYFSEDRITETKPDFKTIQTHELAGTVLACDSTEKRILVGLRNRLTNTDEAELLLPDKTLTLRTDQMRDQTNQPLPEGHNGYKVYFPIDQPVPTGAVIRRKIGA